MGKTVKGRAVMSIASFLFVVAFCLVANSSVPKLYESYKQRVVAQQAASQTATHEIKKDMPTENTTPAEDVAEPVEDAIPEEDANVYDIPEEEPAVEEAPEEEPEEEEDFDFDFDIDDGNDEENKEESGGFFAAIISFITSLIEKISSFDIFAKIKDFFAGILKIFGIEL